MIFYLFILSAHSLLLDTFSGYLLSSVQFSSVIQSCPVQHTRLPCPLPTPQACSNSCPSSQWCHPTISFAVIPSSSHLQSLPESGAFPMSRLLPSGGQSIGTSASALVLPVNTQDWFPLGLTGWISVPSKGLSRVFSDTTVRKYLLRYMQISTFSGKVDPFMLWNVFLSV